MYYYLIYISKAIKAMTEEDLLILLTQSRDWNASHGITGMLLYIRQHILTHKAGRFIQVLEGNEADVKSIFEKIKKDKKHDHITLLNEGTVKQRNFETWLMGFESLDINGYEQKPGFFELDDNFLNSGQSQRLNVPLTFLKSFYTMGIKPKNTQGL